MGSVWERAWVFRFTLLRAHTGEAFDLGGSSHEAGCMDHRSLLSRAWCSSVLQGRGNRGKDRAARVAATTGCIALLVHVRSHLSLYPCLATGHGAAGDSSPRRPRSLASIGQVDSTSTMSFMLRLVDRYIVVVERPGHLPATTARSNNRVACSPLFHVFQRHRGFCRGKVPMGRPRGLFCCRSLMVVWQSP